jgi:4-amino-4-deoxy-L-arabinose transferase
MIETGDWVVPRFDGLRYFEKPVMGYWINALSLKAFGENAFAVRFPSAVAAGLSALMIFWLTGHATRDRFQALLATAIYLTSLEVYGVGVFSVLDSMVSFFLTATMVFLYKAWDRRHVPRMFLIHLFLAGLFCGFAFHTKGFLAFVIPIGVAFTFGAWMRDLRRLCIMATVLTAVAVFVVLPWGIAIHRQEPEFWDFFVWNEHIRRFMAHDAQHKRTFFYFLMILPLGFFPWSALWPAMAKGVKRIGTDGPFFRYLLLWFSVPFLFFSASSGKLATYILPCFPPLAIIMAMGLSAFKREDDTVFNYGAVGLVGFVSILAMGVVLAQSGWIKGFVAYQNPLKAVVFMGSLVIFAGGLVLAMGRHSNGTKLACFAAAPLAFYLSLHFLMPSMLVSEQSPGSFFETNQSMVTADTILASSGPPVGAVCWSFKRRDVYVVEGGGELDYGLSWSDSRHRQLSLDALRALIETQKGAHPVVVIADAKRFDKWKEKLPVPKDVKSDNSQDYVMARY